MKKHLLTAIAALAFSGACFADNPPLPIPGYGHDVTSTPHPKECTQWCKPFWSSMPKLEYGFYVAELADISTTLDIKHHPGYYEQNPLLGRHPSDARVIAEGGIAALIHSAITYEMVDQNVPKPIINTWEIISIGVETGFAAHNLHIGLHFSY